MIKIYDYTFRAQALSYKRFLPKLLTYMGMVAEGGVRDVGVSGGLDSHLAAALIESMPARAVYAVHMDASIITQLKPLMGIAGTQCEVVCPRPVRHSRMGDAELKEISRYLQIVRKAGFSDISVVFEDGLSIDRSQLLDMSHQVVSEGARTVVVADTSSTGVPSTVGKTIWVLRQSLPNRVELGVRCHNGLGLAVANSIEACHYGARIVQAVAPHACIISDLPSWIDILRVLQSVYPHVPTMPMSIPELHKADDFLTQTWLSSRWVK